MKKSVSLIDGRYTGGVVISNHYNAQGRLSAVEWPENRVDILWDTNKGQVVSVTATNGFSLGYEFDGVLLTNVAAGGTITGIVSYTYNNDFMPVGLTVNGASTINYQYDDDMLLSGAGSLSLQRNAETGFISNSVLGNVSADYAFNGFGELSSCASAYNSSNLFTVSYDRDKLGRITNRTEAIQSETNEYAYVYDDAGRLVSVRTNGTVYSTYQYDANGNRTNAMVGGASVAGIYDAQDRMTAYGSATCQYSQSGTLTNKMAGGQTTRYRYDANGSLLGVVLPSGENIEYLVDPLGRRIGKKVNGAFVQGFLYQDYLNPVAELDSSGKVVSHFVYGTRHHVPEYMVKNGVTYRFITDHLGSVRLVVNAQTGEVVQRMDYDEFGRVLQDTNPGFQPFGFAGGLYDDDTELTRFGYRDYDPETGRFLSKDPIGISGGLNQYVFCDNDPVNYIDPFGLDNQNPGSWGYGNVNNTVPPGVTGNGQVIGGGQLKPLIGTVGTALAVESIALPAATYGLPWLKSRFLYEVGQKTLPDWKYNLYKHLDPISRGSQLIKDFGFWRAVAPEGRGLILGIGKTFSTGPTPGGWLALAGGAAGLGYEGYYLWDKYFNDADDECDK